GSATSGTTSPSVTGRGPPRRSALATGLGRKSSCSIARRTRSAISGATPASALTTRETVFRLTPARKATSRIVGRNVLAICLTSSWGSLPGATRIRDATAPGYAPAVASPPRHRVEIEYCTRCRWMLRAAWIGQELLTTFEAEIGSLTLVPSVGGVFDVRV